MWRKFDEKGCELRRNSAKMSNVTVVEKCRALQYNERTRFAHGKKGGIKP
jgi:hypothetical protein